jgi:hypothetical protein
MTDDTLITVHGDIATDQPEDDSVCCYTGDCEDCNPDDDDPDALYDTVSIATGELTDAQRLLLADLLTSGKLTVEQLVFVLRDQAGHTRFDEHDPFALDTLDPTMPIEAVDAELRADGLDPDAIGERGAQLAHALLHGQRQDDGRVIVPAGVSVKPGREYRVVDKRTGETEQVAPPTEPGTYRVPMGDVRYQVFHLCVGEALDPDPMWFATGSADCWSPEEFAQQGWRWAEFERLTPVTRGQAGEDTTDEPDPFKGPGPTHWIPVRNSQEQWTDVHLSKPFSTCDCDAASPSWCSLADSLDLVPCSCDCHPTREPMTEAEAQALFDAPTEPLAPEAIETVEDGFRDDTVFLQCCKKRRKLGHKAGCPVSS